MKKIYFITGSQDLYGEETLAHADRDAHEMASFLNDTLKDYASIVATPIVRNSKEAFNLCMKATADEDCIGVITWMHTFSPAKMWIKALQILKKPMLHLHTQFNEKLPYDSIDPDFMNLNQSAHGDREFGFICTRLGIKREVVVGYYKNPRVIEQIKRFIEVATAIDYSKNLKVAMFGNNMRDVAVTDGDRVESEIKYGWNVNYYGIGDLCDIINKVTDDEIENKIKEYNEKYTMDTEDMVTVKEQAKYEIAIEKFLKKTGAGAITDTFEDLHGMHQLPGLAVQNLMARGMGFGPEGDYKTSGLGAVLCKMSEKRKGATGFSEDYTYDLTDGQEVELASHMLEVSPVFAKDRPKIQVHPMGIGGKEDPARLVFEGIEGDAIAVSMIDMGDRFRLICAEINMINQPEPMPNLPVAHLMWKLEPDFNTGAACWIYAGGAHHAVISTALTMQDIRLFAKMTNTELVCIDKNTKLEEFEDKLEMLSRGRRI